MSVTLVSGQGVKAQENPENKTICRVFIMSRRDTGMGGQEETGGGLGQSALKSGCVTI